MSSSRLAIAQGVVAMLQGLQNGNNPLYSFVKLGAAFSPGAEAGFTGTWCEVTFAQSQSGPAGSGGNLIGWRIEDNPVFKLTSGFDYAPDATAAQIAMLTTMDILMPVLHSHYTIPQAGNQAVQIASVYSLLEDKAERSFPLKFPDGHIYLLWETFCTAKQQYNVTLVTP